MRNWFVLALIAVLACACSPEQRCYRNEDCDDDMVCDASGACGYQCVTDEDCGRGFACNSHHRCIASEAAGGETSGPDTTPTKQFVCPEGMASIRDAYCIDQYEASRPDATETSAGQDDSMATSRKGVKPWNVGDNNAAAQAACVAAGKRLCTPTEWEFSCHGVNDTVYGYGDVYDPQICNGLYTYGENAFHLMPTGSFEACQNGWNVYDMSGNLWEHTADGSAKTARGGAYNCVDTENNHKCSYVPNTWTPLSIGFRCCSDGTWIETKAPDKSESSDSSDDEEGEPHAALIPQIRSTVRQVEALYDEFITARLGHHSSEVLLAWDESTSDTMSDVGHNFVESDDSECVASDKAIRQAQILMEDSGTARGAIEVLKAARSCHEDDLDVVRLLGIAYAKVDNYPWALRMLKPLVARDPSDCAARAWIAWIQIQMALPDEAEQTLSEGAVCGEAALDTRLQVLRVYNDIAAGNDVAAKEAVKKADSQGSIMQSDSVALDAMKASLGVVNDPNLSWKIELDGGYASNALSGSPTDPSLMNKSLSSAFLDGDVRVTLDPVKEGAAHPILEAQATGQYLFAKDAQSASYVDLSLRAGLSGERVGYKFGVWYKPEFLIVSGGDKYDEGPLHFYTGHRLEIDAEIQKWLYIFAGYGHRTFRQAVRTRDELDIGAGGYHALGAGFGLTWGASYRQWLSHGDMYNLFGVNASMALEYTILPVNMLIRLQGSFAYDDYPDSEGYFQFGTTRQDKLVRGSLQVWSPSWHGVRVGAQFKASRRWSSADDYDFEDYRGLIALRWTGDLYFYSPSVSSDDVYSLPWNFESGHSTERIRDLIRQDEDMQRSSSCLQN